MIVFDRWLVGNCVCTAVASLIHETVQKIQLAALPTLSLLVSVQEVKMQSAQRHQQPV